MPPPNRADFDSPWKEALEKYFQPFLELCFPEISRDVDWSRGYELLDKELQRVVRDAQQGRGHVDKLVKVWRYSGAEAWVLIHVEVQHEPEPGFPQRLFDYNVRLRQRYGKMVVSLSVLTDNHPGWRPREFTEELWGFRVGMQFPVVKLLDLAKRRGELERSENPFAVVVLAQLDALETGDNPDERSQRKLRLVRALYDRGFSRDEILELFRLIDWLLRLPEELEDRFRNDVAEYEEERQMPYITSVERLGIRKGLQQGLQQGLEQGLGQGLEESLLRFLRASFGPLPNRIIAAISSVDDRDRLAHLQERAAVVSSLDEFEHELLP